MLSLRPSRIVAALAVALAVAGLGAARAAACGSGGYSYAGVAGPARVFGVSATITPVGAFDVVSGHVAGWVGVGGPGLGPNSTDEWIQVGFSGFPTVDGNDIYYEVALPNRQPTYHQVAESLPIGKAARVAVREMRTRPNHWRVWLNGQPVSGPIYLPGSHGRWVPVATAEAWDGGGDGACNGFLYRFRGISVASSPGGAWQRLVGGLPITSPSTRLARSGSEASFLAAEGDAAFRNLAAFVR